MTTTSVAVARSPISVITNHLMRRHASVQDSRRACTHAKRTCMFRMTMTGTRDNMSLTRTRSRIHSLINGGYEGGTRGSRRNYSILASDFSECLHTQCTMPGSHPLYYILPTEAYDLSTVHLRPKWLQCNRQVDSHNLVRVVEYCAIFE